MFLKSIQFKNIGSFGDVVRTLNFDKEGKLIQLKGRSGSGKSTLLSLPSLLYYGKTSGINKNAIANRLNKNGWIRGEILSGDASYIIERGFSPTFLKVLKYEDGEYVDIDATGSRDAQEFIISEIIKMPQSIFDNVISLNLNSFKSFLTMTPYEKTQIIDRIFNMEIINVIHAAIKKDIRDISQTINTNNNVIESLNRTIESSRRELLKLNESNKADADIKIQANNDLIAQIVASYNNLSTQLQEITTKENSINTLINKYNSEVSELKHEITTLQKQLDIFHEDKCPTCSTSFNSAEFADVRDQLMESISDRKGSIEAKELEMSKFYDARKTLSEYNKNITDNMRNLILKKQSLDSENKLIIEDTKAANQTSSINNIVNKSNEQRTEILETIHTMNDKLTDLSMLESIYSSEGIKKEILTNYIPYINSDLKDILISMSIGYTIEFDVNFNAKAYSLGEEINLNTLSTGEHKRVDLAILCAILKLIKRKFHQINILYLDETLSSLDAQTANDVVKYLHDISKELNLTCIIVSHNSNLSNDMISQNILIEKPAAFSQLTFEDLED